MKSVIFNGSSSHAAQIRDWMYKGGVGTPPNGEGVHTCDICNLELTLQGCLYRIPPNSKISVDHSKASEDSNCNVVNATFSFSSLIQAEVLTFVEGIGGVDELK